MSILEYIFLNSLEEEIRPRPIYPRLNPDKSTLPILLKPRQSIHLRFSIFELIEL